MQERKEFKRQRECTDLHNVSPLPGNHRYSDTALFPYHSGILLVNDKFASEGHMDFHFLAVLGLGEKNNGNFNKTRKRERRTSTVNKKMKNEGIK